MSGDKLRRELKRFVRAVNMPYEAFVATVSKVNEQEGTCAVVSVDESPERFKVKLNASAETEGVIIIPKVGSFVVVLPIGDPNNLAVLRFTKIEKIKFLTGVGEWSMVKGESMKAEVEKLKAAVDLILNAINNGVPAVGSADGGAAFQTTMKTIIATANTGNFTNILNDKVTHG